MKKNQQQQVPDVDVSTLGRGRALAVEAARQGLLRLPEHAVDIMHTLATVDAATVADPPDPVTLRSRYHEVVLQALRGGERLPEAPAELMEVERQERAAAEQRDALQAARGALAADLSAALPTDDVVTQLLRPAIDKVLAEARGLVDKYGAGVLQMTAEQVVAEAPGQATAWSRFGDLVQAYSLLRQAHGELTSGARDDNVFRELHTDPRDAALFGKDGWFGQNMRPGWTPWPTEPRPHLVWLVTADVTVWTPTADQREQRFSQVFPPAAPVSVVGGERPIPLELAMSPRW